MAEIIYGDIPTSLNLHFTDVRPHNIGLENIRFTNDLIGLINPKDKSIINKCIGFVADANDIYSNASRLANNYSIDKSQRPTSITNQPNSPIKNIKIINRLGSFGGAKVLIDDGTNQYISNLEHDILMDVILNGKINKKGLLTEDYVWARVRNKMKLIRVESDIYDKIIRYQAVKKLPKIAKSNFVPGTIYKTLSGDIGIFIKNVNTTLFTSPPRTGYQFFYDGIYDNFVNQERHGAMFFLELNKKIKQPLKDLKLANFSNFSYPLIKLSHSFIEDTGIKLNIPKDFDDMVVKFIQKNLVKGMKTGGEHWIKNRMKSVLMSNSGILNMRDVGKTDYKIYNVNKVLNFI